MELVNRKLREREQSALFVEREVNRSVHSKKHIPIVRSLDPYVLCDIHIARSQCSDLDCRFRFFQDASIYVDDPPSYNGFYLFEILIVFQIVKSSNGYLSCCS